MNKQYDYLVFIGRFQPFHAGHAAVVNKALELANEVIILVGSANKSRSVKNPFTYAERANMILSGVGSINSGRVHVRAIFDFLYNEDKWRAGVQTAVYNVANAKWFAGPDRRKIGIIGHEKDASSYYINKFPQWDLVKVPLLSNVHATEIREAMFEQRHDGMTYKGSWNYPDDWFTCPEHYSSVISAAPDAFGTLRKEHEILKAYKKSWETAPFPPTFVTVDAVVTQSAHILMVKRGAAPGEGLWALPGGFLNQDEWIEDAAIRELVEETQIGVHHKVLKGSVKTSHVFDAPMRSARGRTITHAFWIDLPEVRANEGLPKIKGSDDAAHAEWIPLADLPQIQDEIFEDHFDIVSYFTGI